MKHANKSTIDKDGEVRELTAADLKQFRPVDKTLPGSLQAKLGVRRRGPQKSPTGVNATPCAFLTNHVGHGSYGSASHHHQL